LIGNACDGSGMPAPVIDPRIAADSVAIGTLALSDLRLMNDSRFPWLILVPRVQAIEIIDLAPADRTHLLEEIVIVSTALREVTQSHKLNVAALGNLVRQLHVHVIARFTRDAAWPKPVWGIGEAVAYDPSDRDRLTRQILGALQRQANTRTE
jgi:diadenosine tetraphosphate (Ap4A) HIT family hydrolase